MDIVTPTSTLEVYSDRASGHISAAQRHSLIGGLRLLKVDKGESLRLTGLAIGGHAHVGDGTALSEGGANIILRRVP